MSQTAQNNFVDLPDIHSKETRTRLAQMVLQLFGHWDLSTSDQGALLGLSSNARTTLSRYRNGGALADNTDLLGRVGHLMAIHKSLRIIFPHDRDLAYRWISQPNRRFDGQTPLEIMKRGYEGLITVRRYLDFERGR